MQTCITHKYMKLGSEDNTFSIQSSTKITTLIKILPLLLQHQVHECKKKKKKKKIEERRKMKISSVVPQQPVISQYQERECLQGPNDNGTLMLHASTFNILCMVRAHAEGHT